MNDVLMLFFLSGILLLCFCLIRSLRQMAASDSRRIRRCRQAAAVLVFDAVMLLSPVKKWMAALCFWVLESKSAEGFRDVVFVKRNYEIQYFLIWYLGMNLLILGLGFVLFFILERVADRGRIYQFGKLEIWQKLLHLPWMIADLCYENRAEGPVLHPWAAVLGKWIRNLSDAILVLMGSQAILGIVSVYIRIDWLLGEQGMAVFSGWYLVPSVLWLTAIQLGGFLEYCPGERQDRQRIQKEDCDETQKKLFEAVSSGASAAVIKTVRSDEWLSAYLYESFQRRRRIAVVCHTKEQEKQWRSRLEENLSKQYDRICLIRFGSIVDMQNQQDTDILLITLQELISLELDRIFPFWYQQVQAIILSDTHGILSYVGQETDVFFSLWKRKKEPVQYLFLDCAGNAQEKQALEYFAEQTVQIYGEFLPRPNELLPWEVDSQKAKMRRMLLEMQQEQGVSEEWIAHRQVQFGMAELRTEAFLKHVLNIVFEGHQVQNLYDSFLFMEETGCIQSNWRIRLTDPGLISRLNERDRAECSEPEAAVGMSDVPVVCMKDQVYRLQDMAVLALGMEQEKKRLLLYQAFMTCETQGIFTWPEIGGIPDFSRESYYEKRMGEQKPYEVTVLRMMLSMKEATEETEVLSALFSLVCNQVFSVVFPYHKDAICTGSAMKNEGRSIFCRILPEEEFEPPSHCVTVDLIETQPFEQGLTAVIRRNSKDFFDTCTEWLERAKEDPLSKEASILAYAQKQLGKEPEQYRAAQKLLNLLGGGG